MKFTFDGNDYDIRFQHRFGPSIGSGKAVRKTKCTISLIDPTIPSGKDRYHGISIGFSTQHVNDQDVKSTARKIALRDAINIFLEQTKYNGCSAAKSIRKRIWMAYFSHCDLKTYIADKNLYYTSSNALKIQQAVRRQAAKLT